MTMFMLSLTLTLVTGFAAVFYALCVGQSFRHSGDQLWNVLALGIVTPLLLVYPLQTVLQTIPAPSLIAIPTLEFFAPGGPEILNEGSEKAGARPVGAGHSTLFILWLIGMLARLGFEMLREQRLARLIRSSSTARPETVRRVQALAAITGAERPIGVRTLNEARSPFVIGLRQPTLMLPERHVADGILFHELAHIRRHDVARSYFARLVGCALWFNPFWFTIERFRRTAVEIQADRMAVNWLGRGAARDYIQLLLKASSTPSAQALHPAFGDGSRRAFKRRITAIVRSKREQPRRLRALACSLAAVITVLPAAGAQAVIDDRGRESPVIFTVAPVIGTSAQVFGAQRQRKGFAGGPQHQGHDVVAASGTPIHAPAKGVVVSAADAGPYGKRLTLDHGQGLQTRYAHLQNFVVAVGDRVQPGDLIALLGNSGSSSGPHLHIEVTINGVKVDPALHLPGLDGK